MNYDAMSLFEVSQIDQTKLSPEEKDFLQKYMAKRNKKEQAAAKQKYLKEKGLHHA